MRHKPQPCWHIRLLCCRLWTANISHNLYFSPFTHDRLVRICIAVFIFLYNKKGKNALFTETAMYSMMDVLFRLKEGECNDWSAVEQNENQTEHS